MTCMEAEENWQTVSVATSTRPELLIQANVALKRPQGTDNDTNEDEIAKMIHIFKQMNMNNTTEPTKSPKRIQLNAMHQGVSLDGLCVQVLKDMQSPDDVMRYMISNTGLSNSRGSHWFCVVYKIENTIE